MKGEEKKGRGKGDLVEMDGKGGERERKRRIGEAGGGGRSSSCIEVKRDRGIFDFSPYQTRKISRQV